MLPANFNRIACMNVALKCLRWHLHWVGQGLKLYLMMVIAAMVTTLLAGPLFVLGEWLFGSVEPGARLIRAIAVGLQVIGVGIGVAVFTAVLHSQLRDHPLREPGSKS